VSEIYVAADDQKELRKYQWDGKRFTRETLCALAGDTITFNLTALPDL
jgi:hypothetical protein